MSKDNINEGLFGAAKEFSDAFFDGLKTNTTIRIFEKEKQRGLPKEIVDSMLRIQKEKEHLMNALDLTKEEVAYFGEKPKLNYVYVLTKSEWFSNEKLNRK